MTLQKSNYHTMIQCLNAKLCSRHRLSIPVVALKMFFSCFLLSCLVRRFGGTYLRWSGLNRLSMMISKWLSLIETRARKNHSDSILVACRKSEGKWLAKYSSCVRARRPPALKSVVISFR